MADRDLRELERQVAAGDPGAWTRLQLRRKRRGLCILCGHDPPHAPCGIWLLCTPCLDEIVENFVQAS